MNEFPPFSGPNGSAKRRRARSCCKSTTWLRSVPCSLVCQFVTSPLPFQVQQIIRANPHFWAPLMVGQMAAAQQAQHSQFAQRFLSNPAAATFGMASAQLEAAENVQQMGNGVAMAEEREEKNVVNGAEEKPGQQAEGRRKAEKRRADREVAEEETEMLLLEHTKRAKWEPKEEQNGGGGEHHQDGHRQS
jgi:hypothetical protein